MTFFSYTLKSQLFLKPCIGITIAFKKASNPGLLTGIRKMACGFRREAGRYTATATTRFLGAKARVGCRVARVCRCPQPACGCNVCFFFRPPARLHHQPWRKNMPYPRKRVWIVSGIILAACIVLAGAGVAYTSGTEFCLSCHEMRVYQDELKLSPHAKDADGKPISCSQCHIPSGNLARMLAPRPGWASRISGCTT